MPDQSKPADGGAASALPVSAEQIEHAAALLDAGGLVAFPTETVYGLGGDAESPDAVARIYAAKGRPANHPVIVLWRRRAIRTTGSSICRRKRSV